MKLKILLTFMIFMVFCLLVASKPVSSFPPKADPPPADKFSASGGQVSSSLIAEAKDFKPKLLPPEEEEDTIDKARKEGYLQFREYLSEPWRLSGQSIPLMWKKIAGLCLIILFLSFCSFTIRKKRGKVYEN